MTLSAIVCSVPSMRSKKPSEVDVAQWAVQAQETVAIVISLVEQTLATG